MPTEIMKQENSFFKRHPSVLLAAVTELHIRSQITSLILAGS